MHYFYGEKKVNFKKAKVYHVVKVLERNYFRLNLTGATGFLEQIT